MSNIHQPICSVIPEYMIRRVADHGDDEDHQTSATTLQQTRLIAARRRQTAEVEPSRAVTTPKKRRSVFDAWFSRTLPGHLIMDENKKSADLEAIEAFEGAGKTYDFYWKFLQRNSIDDRGMVLKSTIHYGQNFDNAMWDGSRMIYGDGDGKLFGRFTGSLDIIAHEHTHGVTQYTAGLTYTGQTGALNEHISDAIGIMVKQYNSVLTGTEDDWLIGRDLFTINVKGKAIRSMAAPGTAYDDPILGRDPQPAHMRDYVRTTDDNGGVHINSGIPNRAYYLAGTGIGKEPWTVLVPIWYHVLTKKLRRNAKFADMARETVIAAGELFGADSQVKHIIRDAWDAVGVPAVAKKSGPSGAQTRRVNKWRDRPAA